MDYRLITTPSESELDSIRQWLYDEYLSFDCKHGFYYNWELIKRGAHEKRVFIYSEKNIPVGLVLWRECEGCVDIDILVISSSKRNFGIGSMFVNKLCDYFRERNSFVVKLFCEPKESVAFWEGKMGFIKYPQRDYSESELTFYKPLIPIATTYTTPLNVTSKLELWNVEPHLATNVFPKWSWCIGKNLSENPIVQPCNYNWNLRLTLNNIFIKEDKVKYFGNNFDRLIKEDFLYIDDPNLL